MKHKYFEWVSHTKSSNLEIIVEKNKTREEVLRQQEIENGYEPLVYENTYANYLAIIAMLLLFYIFNGLHWWANFELGINSATSSTVWNLFIFSLSVIIILLMIYLGAKVNKLKATHAFYQGKISEY